MSEFEMLQIKLEPAGLSLCSRDFSLKKVSWFDEAPKLPVSIQSMQDFYLEFTYSSIITFGPLQYSLGNLTGVLPSWWAQLPLETYL